MITKAYINFFRGLERNNNREWFHEHKNEYEVYVKKPFLELLDQLIPKVKELEPEISTNPKDALFRINRDIRFSKDKTPYNTLMKAGFSPGGKKSFLPGFYLGIGAEKIHMGGGLFNIKAPELKKVRQLIKRHPDTFTNILTSEGFKKSFGQLAGEQAKRLDKEFTPLLNTVPHIANKQFYAMQNAPLSDYLDGKKMEALILKHFTEISKLNHFLKNAF